MKWLNKKKEFEKKDEKSTYITLENGKVVPVVKSNDKVEKKEEEVVKTPNPEDVEEKPTSRSTKWIWLAFMILLAYGTVQLYSQVTIESKEELQLQEIKRNTVEIKKEPLEKTAEKPTNEPSDTLAEKAKDWKDELRGSFETEKDTKPEKQIVDQGVLFDIRQADEDGTEILQIIRDTSVKHIQGDMSRGQYILRLQSIELKMNRYEREVSAIDSKLSKGHRYHDHLDYVQLKADGLSSLITELRIVQSTGIADTFNDAVDFHNELTKEADALFVEELKQMGYTVKVQNGTIHYE